MAATRPGWKYGPALATAIGAGVTPGLSRPPLLARVLGSHEKRQGSDKVGRKLTGDVFSTDQYADPFNSCCRERIGIRTSRPNFRAFSLPDLIQRRLFSDSRKGAPQHPPQSRN